MRQRCNNTKAKKYGQYGAKGVSICKEWDKYETFKEWALSSGYEEHLTIDRIDVLGNYEPSNCQWITNNENARKGQTEDAIRRNKKESK